MNNYEYLLKDINTIKGIGPQISKLFKKKNINTVFDLLWSLPREITDRRNLVKINQLQVGKIQTISVNVIKYNFPRIRNLPNKVYCQDDSGKIECTFFNSYEGYIKKILPINARVTISGKIGYYNKKYQITNPTYVSTKSDTIKKIIPTYSLTDGLTEKKYNSIVNEVLTKIPDLNEWLSHNILKKFNYITWKKSILELHNPININKKGNFLNRLIFDEILSHFLINSKIRRSVKKIKKKNKKFDNNEFNKIIKKFGFELSYDQKSAIDQINNDLKSNQKMFRLLQGDVGSGKTIVALIASANVISSGFQVSLMAPTEILAKQHYDLAKKLLNKNLNIKILTSKTDRKERKEILKDLSSNKIHFLIGTHSLYQEKIQYNNLGLVIIDEQHKFGVRQRKKLSDKGGKNCDVLVMSATPIPRTMIMTIFGDMDTSIIKTKPKNRKEIKTYSKLESKINEVINFAKEKISQKNQVFWVCPLIEESKKIDHQSSVKRFHELKKIFKNKVGLLHGALSKQEKDSILLDFLNKKIDILVSTTVIEVGIDFPNANIIIIENANKFGLSQLHQLRGRVGRGEKQGTCILLFKDGLTKNAIERIKILKNSDDGFFIAEEDLKLRGFGDLIGYQQSGLKNFRFAHPVIHEDLFKLAENFVNNDSIKFNQEKYSFLLKLFDKADIINISDI